MIIRKASITADKPPPTRLSEVVPGISFGHPVSTQRITIPADANISRPI
jgi:hypothetical protein